MQYRAEIELRGGVRARSPQPYGGATPFHDDVDGDGCLMDRGYDEVDCLAEILAP